MAVIYMKDTSYDAFLEAVEKAIDSGAGRFNIAYEEDYAFGEYIDTGYYNVLRDYVKNCFENHPGKTKYISRYGKSGGLLSGMENADFVIWGEFSEINS